MEARPESDPLAVSPILDIVLGSHQHWQCKGCRLAKRPQNDRWAMECLARRLLRLLFGVRARE